MLSQPIASWAVFLLAAHATVPVSAAPTTPQQTPSIPLNVNIQVYRHGRACYSSNIEPCMNQTALKTNPLCYENPSNTRDPILTDYGVKASKNTAKWLQRAWEKGFTKRPDVVFTSALLRATETGFYTFPQFTIYQAPYLAECEYGSRTNETLRRLPGSPSGTPITPSDQFEALKEVTDDEEDLARINYTYVNQWAGVNCSGPELITSGEPRCLAGTWQTFLGWLANVLVQNTPTPELAGKVLNGEDVTVAVVTHGDYIGEMVFERDYEEWDGAFNNQGYETVHLLDKEKKTLTRADGKTGPWPAAFGAPGATKICKESKGGFMVMNDDYDGVIDFMGRCIKREPELYTREFVDACFGNWAGMADDRDDYWKN